MKRFLLLLVCALSSTLLISQDVPQGMKYQAVARDADGDILAKQEIRLKVSLQNQGTISEVYYVEEHMVTTTELGMFSLTIGSGKAASGEFSKIPWSTTDVWMQVSFARSSGDPYRVISDSRMLSVPYAFHAATASQLVSVQSGIDSEDDEDGRTPDPGSNSNNWHTDGNVNTDPEVDFLGTTDTADLVIITNNIERIRVLQSGDVLVANSQRIGKNLEVRDSVWLNTQGGETRNYGPFTVDLMSPTLLSGTLTVDEETDLNSSLNVDGPTDLNSSLDVNNESPTTLTGTLVVDGISTFTNTTNSTNRANGAVIIQGGAGIDSNLNVGGNFDVRGTGSFGGEVTFESPVTITAEDESTNTGNGALIVFGGMGLGKRLNVGGATALGNTLQVTGATSLLNTLDVSGATTLNGATQINNTLTVGPYATNLGGTLGVAQATNLASILNVNNGAKTTLSGALDVSGITRLLNAADASSTNSGSLVVSGGVGIAKKLYVGGAMQLNNQLTVRNAGGMLAYDASKVGTGHVALFENTTAGSGIAVKLGSGQPVNQNNFMTFFDSHGNVVGRIEGESTQADLDNNQGYIDDLYYFDVDYGVALTGEIIAGAELIQAAVSVASAATSSTGCAGLGACVTAPIPSLNVEAAAGIILAGANFALAAADAILVALNKQRYIDNYAAELGVTFASGSEDYAEYLPKLDPNELFSGGELIGMKNGMITKNTDNADKIMVISIKPAVLGGLPALADQGKEEMVAFMGQVPTNIMGPVQKGDYILPSGYHNGFGVARHPDKMKVEDYKNVLGVAWESADGPGLNMVNVAIGINTNVIADLVTKQAARIDQQAGQLKALESQMQQTQIALAQLVPGFKDAVNVDTEGHAISVVNGDQGSLSHTTTQYQSDVTFGAHPHDRSEASEIVYYEINNEEIEAAFTMVEAMYEKNNMDITDHPYWKRIKTEPGFKDQVKEEIREQMRYSMHIHKEINGVQKDH